MEFETLKVTLDAHIATICLNRPDKANAMNATMWQEIRRAFEWVDATPEARVAVLEGEGKAFSAGIDLGMMAGVASTCEECEGRRFQASVLEHRLGGRDISQLDARTMDGEALLVQQLANPPDQQHFMMLVVTAIAPALDWPQLGKFLLPIAQYMRLHVAQHTRFTNREIAFCRNGW